MKLRVGDKEFSVKVADTPAKRTTGLLPIRKGSMPKDGALMLKWDEPAVATITMKGMKFPIDIIFVKDNMVQKVLHGEIDQENIGIADKSDFVLEVLSGAADGIKSGDNVTSVGEKLEDGTIQKAEGGVIADEGSMQVLDEDGKVQGNIEGDERIFSRKHTTKLCELAECAYSSKADNDYKKLGMAMMRMIDKQDTQEQEYTDN